MFQNLKFGKFGFISDFVLRISDFWPALVLALIAVVLCISNYIPGTFLSGWDTLHPEFNFGLNFERTINGVFRAEQGLGAVAAHSHMADLPRIVILYIAHFALPLSFLRYFYIDLCLILGGLGMYFFLKKSVLKSTPPSFLGALFYLLNLGTVQTFNVPFEMFTTLFATLPFIFLFATEYLEDKAHRNKYLLLFAFIMLLNAPSAYASTLWYVFFLCFIVYFFIFSLLKRNSDKTILKSFFVLVGVTLIVNLFWLLPNIYFLLTHAKEVAQANINLLFSDQAFFKNKEFGNLKDILLIKTFYFDWKIYAGNNQFVDLLSPYITYLNSSVMLFLSYLLSFWAVGGLIFIIKNLKKSALPFISILVICLFFLFNDNFPVSVIYSFLQDHLPFFKEAMRFPGDKILNIYSFLVSVFFGYFALIAIEKLKKFNLKLRPDLIFTGTLVIVLIVTALPGFSGNLINKYVKVEIPKYYFSFFDYLNAQPDEARVANLPIHSPWGWAYYNWPHSDSSKQGPSYQGAGFLYFGIKQPLLDRDFDRWSPYNESYYREMSYAIYREDPKLLSSVINKYRIGFIMVDKSVINPQNAASALYFNQSENLISLTGLVAEKRSFGTIDLYKLKIAPGRLTEVRTNLNVAPETTSIYSDTPYLSNGDYLTSDNTSLSQNYYPFRNLINNQSKVKPEIIKDDGNNLILSSGTNNKTYQTGSVLDTLTSFPVSLVALKTQNTLTLNFKPDTPTLNKLQLGNTHAESFPLAKTQTPILLSINNGELINLTPVALNTPTFIKDINLINGDNNLSVFNRQNIQTIDNLPTKISPIFSSCEPDGTAPTAGFTNSGIKLSGKNDLCILIPYRFLPANDIKSQTILTSFDFNFSGNAKISSCLYDLHTSSCINYQNQAINGSKITFTYPVGYSDIPNLALKLIINSQNKNINIYNLDKISAEYETPVSENRLPPEAVAQMFKNIQKAEFTGIIIPKTNTYNSSFEIAKTNLKNDCKAADAKKELLEQNEGKIIKYTANSGSFCDHFSYPNLPHDQGYLIEVKSKNESGLPLTLCLSNYTSKKCDIYASLTSLKKSTSDIFLLPPMDKGGLGYDINLENLGINKSPSTNYLYSVEIVPIPYQYLQQIHSEDLNQNMTLVSLNRSFEPMFQAYQIDCPDPAACRLKSFFAPIIGKALTNHVLVDNWSNGWIIDKSNIKDQKLNIKITYWPQYLEYAGFLLLLVLFLVLLVRLKPEKHHKALD